MNSPLITVEEAAQILHCKRTTVFRLLSEGKLQRGLKVGKRTVVRADSVYALIEAGSEIEVPKKKAPRRKRKAQKVEPPEVGYGDGILSLLNQAAFPSASSGGSSV